MIKVLTFVSGLALAAWSLLASNESATIVLLSAFALMSSTSTPLRSRPADPMVDHEKEARLARVAKRYRVDDPSVETDWEKFETDTWRVLKGEVPQSAAERPPLPAPPRKPKPKTTPLPSRHCDTEY